MVKDNSRVVLKITQEVSACLHVFFLTLMMLEGGKLLREIYQCRKVRKRNPWLAMIKLINWKNLDLQSFYFFGQDNEVFPLHEITFKDWKRLLFDCRVDNLEVLKQVLLSHLRIQFKFWNPVVSLKVVWTLHANDQVVSQEFGGLLKNRLFHCEDIISC